MNKKLAWFFVVTTMLLTTACGGGGGGSGGDDSAPPASGFTPPPGGGTNPPPSSTPKPLPGGVYESAGFGEPVLNAVDNAALKGVLVRFPWDECGDDQGCLLDEIEDQLDKAQDEGLQVALMVFDGDHAPAGVKSRCLTFNFIFQGSTPASMCLPWDSNYLADKQTLVAALGQRFDAHPALAYVYFTAACSTNGGEGHCRIDEAAFTNAGYTPQKMADAYSDIMGMYRDAFPTTPIAFEVHAIFDSAEPWQTLWDEVKDSGRVGVAAWWCAEKLSVRGGETVPVWSIVQDAAQRSFSVCQTVGNLTNQPYRFSDTVLGLDYGIEGAWTSADALDAFNDTIDWAQGYEVHAGQSVMITPFTVMEVWSADMNNNAFEARLMLFE